MINFIELITDMYDPACVYTVNGWKLTLRNDDGFRKIFDEEYGQNNESKILDMAQKYMKHVYARGELTRDIKRISDKEWILVPNEKNTCPEELRFDQTNEY